MSEASGFIGRGAFAVGALEAWAVCREHNRAGRPPAARPLLARLPRVRADAPWGGSVASRLLTTVLDLLRCAALTARARPRHGRGGRRRRAEALDSTGGAYHV